METIISIREITNLKVETDFYGSFDGYEVLTNKQSIKLLISNGQSCCEDWGYFMSDDDFKDFEGSNLIKIDLVDEALNVQKRTDVYEGGIMFVNLYTSSGMLQFVAYNSHNGYYGHQALVISEQLNHCENL